MAAKLDEYRSVGDVIVNRFRIIGTRTLVYQALERWSSENGIGSHSSLTSVDGRDGWYGRVGTKRLPANLDALPAMTQERFDAVDAWHGQEYDRAYAAIIAAYPEAEGGRRRMGEIEITV